MKDHFIEGVCSFVELPPSAIDSLNTRISNTNRYVNSVSNRVTQITPYEETKSAYIGDTEVRFNRAKEGMVKASVITDSGYSVAYTMELSQSEVVVKFDELEELATVTISIQ